MRFPHCPLAALALGVALSGCRPPATGAPPPGPVSEAEAAARKAVADERRVNAASFPERSLGVAPFAVPASDTSLSALGYGLADILITDLQRSGQLQLVDRIRVDALLREIQLADAGRVDPSTAPRVGKLVGARRIVIGALSQRPGGQLAIDARVADVATGDVRSAVSASAPLADILAAEKELALRLLTQLGVNLSPAARARIEERPTRNIAALLAYSRAVRFEVRGDYQRAATEYRTALRLDPTFSLANERLSEVPSSSPSPTLRADASRSTQGSSIARASGVAVDRVNPVFFSPLAGGPRAGAGGVADPTFPSQTVVVLITITTPP
ncbi:MAG TPA: CsgG/HfaB family protein [Gemmatimonadaceae bacterium]|nr:CsgG/HfaB family protein [Gemmatimonadaceae bacterium]